MDVLFVSSEVAPWSKTGGLGDVASSLPGALAARGHRVAVVTPRYGSIDPTRHGLVRLPEVVEARGGRLALIPFLPGHSTSRIEARIRSGRGVTLETIP